MKPHEESHEIEITPKLKQKLHEYSQLHDFYGEMLTEKQNTCFTMHYLEDYSLAEIGEALGITPQAVADQVKRTVGILRRYEEKLGFIKSWEKQQTQLNLINNTVTELIEEGYPLKPIIGLLDEVRRN